MPASCPNCGSRDLRPATVVTREERFNSLRFIQPLRCKDCRTRFIARTAYPEEIFYARCPQCDRLDLSVWTGKTFRPPLLSQIKIILGANRWRCEYCRLNFASFRRRKEVFTFDRWKRRKSVRVAEGPGSGAPAGGGGAKSNGGGSVAG